MEDGRRQGPVSSRELKAMADAARITQETLVFKEGGSEWVAASMVKGLFEHPAQPPDPSRSPYSAAGSSAASKVFETAREQASLLMRDLRALNWREEVFPIDEPNLRVMTRDYVFWCVILLGILPQLIGTIEDFGLQLTVYAFFFAAMWGVVFRDFILRTPVKWSWLLAAAFFTGIIGLQGLLLLYATVFPKSYSQMPFSENLVVSLLGFVLHTGVLEELCKAVPVLAYLMWKRKNAEPLTAILLGVFSGLGFAAFETVGYGSRSIGDSQALARE
jgi:hypothetical protein